MFILCESVGLDTYNIRYYTCTTINYVQIINYLLRVWFVMSQSWVRETSMIPVVSLSKKL